MASFKKYERLTGSRQIEKLFDRTGTTFKFFPLLFIIRQLTFSDEVSVKALISVSKKRLPRAVDRNCVKRRIRAIHQTHKLSLTKSIEQRGSCGVGIVYLTDSVLDSKEIDKAYLKFLKKIDATDS